MAAPDDAPEDFLPGHPTYRFVKALSSGGFGVVHLYQHRTTDEYVAIKFIERGADESKYVELEVLNHRWLKHPHVVKFKELFLTPKHICIAMEFANGGTLFRKVSKAGPLEERAARWFFQQLILALDYCHRPGAVKPSICNRDIKLENILLEKMQGSWPLVKICDFGYSKNGLGSKPKSKVGTLVYMAPEVLCEDVYDGQQADIWSCGVCLYVMLAGSYPFYPLDPQAPAHTQDVMNRILKGEWQLPQGVTVSPECHDILSRLLTVDPTQRLTMAGVQAHPWFLSNLPPTALSLGEQCLDIEDYSDVQSEQDIKAILKQAMGTKQGVDDMIDAAIGEEKVGGLDPYGLALTA